MEFFDKIPQWVWFIIVPIVFYLLYSMLRGRDWSIGKFQAKIPKDETTIKAKNANTGTNHGHVGDFNYSPTYNISSAKITEDRNEEIKFSDKEKALLKKWANSETYILDLTNTGFINIYVDGSKEYEFANEAECKYFFDRVQKIGYANKTYNGEVGAEFILNLLFIDEIKQL